MQLVPAVLSPLRTKVVSITHVCLATCAFLKFFLGCKITWRWLHGDLPSWLVGSRYVPSSPLVKVILASLFLCGLKLSAKIAASFVGDVTRLVLKHCLSQTSHTSWDASTLSQADRWKCPSETDFCRSWTSVPHCQPVVLPVIGWEHFFLHSMPGNISTAEALQTFAPSGHGTQCCTHCHWRWSFFADRTLCIQCHKPPKASSQSMSWTVDRVLNLIATNYNHQPTIARTLRYQRNRTEPAATKPWANMTFHEILFG